MRTVDRRLLILHLRTARRRAREAALREALCLLQEHDPEAPAGGPLSEQGGVYWVSVPERELPAALELLPRLGYTDAADLLTPRGRPRIGGASGSPGQDRGVRWRGVEYYLDRVYEEDAGALRERAPDRRTFVLEFPDGSARAVKGYRGDGKAGSRRGLPVCDARLLVNLVYVPGRGVLLDPFAGIGGIALEAVESGWRVETVDVDPALRHGLAAISARHTVADARDLPYTSESADAIATEPPYDDAAGDMLAPVLREMARVLKREARMSLLCASWQAEPIRQAATALGLEAYLDCPVDRKGTDVVALAWRKD